MNTKSDITKDEARHLLQDRLTLWESPLETKGENHVGNWAGVSIWF